MFDPTAFDNMKVILEGALYDLDLEGEIIVTDRNDWMNLAKLSRQFDMTFKKSNQSKTSCTILLKADLTNLAAELNPISLSEKLAGSHFKIVFSIHHNHSNEVYTKALFLLREIWGESRRYTCVISYDPTEINAPIKTEITIDFVRLISEDQLQDLLQMVDIINESLLKLEEY